MISYLVTNIQKESNNSILKHLKKQKATYLNQLMFPLYNIIL